MATVGKPDEVKIYFGRVGDIGPLVTALGAECAALVARRLSLEEGWGFRAPDGQLLPGLHISLWARKGTADPSLYYGHRVGVNLYTLDGLDLLTVEGAKSVGFLRNVPVVAMFVVADSDRAVALPEIGPERLTGRLKELAVQLRAHGVVEVRKIAANFEPDGQLHVRADARDNGDQKISIAIPAPAGNEPLELKTDRGEIYLASLCNAPALSYRKPGLAGDLAFYYSIPLGKCPLLVAWRPFFALPAASHKGVTSDQYYRPLVELTFEAEAEHKYEVVPRDPVFGSGFAVLDRTTKKQVAPPER